MRTQTTDLIFSAGSLDHRVSVIVPLYNYEKYIVDTLESVVNQSWSDLTIIVVDDCSRDESAEIVKNWMQRCAASSSLGLFLLRNKQNVRLATTRNTGVAFSQSEYCFFLDADNLLYPRCIEKHVEALDARADCPAAYGLIEVFDADTGIIGAEVFDRARLKHGNYIDAMAIVRRESLLALGGYHDIRHGWEDYDLWLRICEHDHIALQIPEILSRYRVHSASMLRTTTNKSKNIRELKRNMTKLHPWLDLH